MAITEEDYNKFNNQFYEIINRYPSVLNDKERFEDLSQNDEFIRENEKMVNDGSYL